MRVAIVHYHLQPGGVTTVIATAAAALLENGDRVAVLTSDAGPLTCSAPVREIPGLGYSPVGNHFSVTLTAALRSAATDALGGPPDIWHFHNHSLGKNPYYPDIVAALAESGERLILQLHDLVENGRATNYPLIAGCENLYPVAPRIRYAFLNSRDRDIFTAAGLPSARSVILPNPILPHPIGPPPSGPPILFAPIRGIRRKNLGELVLLAALSPPGCAFAVSRAPTNPTAIPIHDIWRKFSRSHGLRIEFDVVDRFAPAAGASADFTSWIAHASHFVTTSVEEGFGLPFLEAAAAGRPLLGRDLPALTAEFAQRGVNVGRLYQRILVPLDWFTLSVLRGHFTTAMERHFRGYRRPLPTQDIETAFDTLIRPGVIDFANLPEPLQQAVIEKAAEQQNRTTLLVETHGSTEPLCDWLARVIAECSPTVSLDQLSPWAPTVYRAALSGICSSLLQEPSAAPHFLPPEKILTAHLDPRAFHFLLAPPPPARPTSKKFRAAIFDIYGTLLTGPSGAIRPDPAVDPILRRLLETGGYSSPDSPTSALHAAIARHHATARFPFPEIDLCAIWREILDLPPGHDLQLLLEATEAARHPVQPMPGAAEFVQRLSRTGISLGLLSNAQANTLPSLGGLADLFAPELCLLSYRHGIAKPSPQLFQMLADRLVGHGIEPHETLFIGNDPLQDIQPAAAAGFQTALFLGHPDSLRQGECAPDIRFHAWEELRPLF